MAVPNRKESLTYPFLFVALLWLIKIVETIFGVSYSMWGIRPRTAGGLVGILVAPMLHKDFSHLIANTLPMLILGIIVFNFYKKIAFEIFFLIYFFSGIMIWIAARDAFHIGASILIYGFIGFLIASGLFRKEFKAVLLAILVVVVYGSSIYGLIPGQTTISWEGHLFGFFVGLISAWYYRKESKKNGAY